MQNLLFFYWTSVVLMLTLEGMLVNTLKMLYNLKLVHKGHHGPWTSTAEATANFAIDFIR